jgi:hypothetical protein
MAMARRCINGGLRRDAGSCTEGYPAPSSGIRPMPKAGLTGSWNAAMATLPPEWRLMGVVRGPREVDPKISSDSRVAWARGPDGERVEGRGESPEQALDDFTNTMRKSGQAFKVE